MRPAARIRPPRTSSREDVPSGRGDCDRPEGAALLVVRAGREEQGVGRAVVGGPAAEPDPPQAVDDDRLAVRAIQLAVLVPVVTVPAIDVKLSVAKVADDEVAAEPTEVGRRPG